MQKDISTPIQGPISKIMREKFLIKNLVSVPLIEFVVTGTLKTYIWLWKYLFVLLLSIDTIHWWAWHCCSFLQLVGNQSGRRWVPGNTILTMRV